MKIEIVENLEKRMNEDNKYVANVLNGKSGISRKKSEKTLIMAPKTFSKIFSPERVKLILRIEQNKIKNIYQLAKELGRKYEAVYRDIKLLEGFGVIKLKSRESEKIPFIEGNIELPTFSAV